MRIVMTVPFPNTSGPLPKLIPPLIAALEASGCRVMPVCWGRRTDTERTARRAIERLIDIVRIGCAVVSAHPDIVVIQTAHDPVAAIRDLALVWCLRPQSRRLVLQYHGSNPEAILGGAARWYKLATRYVISRTDAIFVLSTDEQRLWRRLIPPGRCFVVSNPLVERPSLIQNPAPHPSLGEQGDVVRLLYVGRLLEAKGILDLVQSLPLLQTESDWALTIAGAGPDSGRLLQLVRALGLSDRVTVTGYLAGQPLAQAYGDADIFVLPTALPEGQPTVITEAMQAGLPVVTTKRRGAADLLVEEANALFVPPHDPAKLAFALDRLIHDRELRLRMGAQNRVDVQKLSPAAVARRYLEGLEQVHRTPRRRRRRPLLAR